LSLKLANGKFQDWHWTAHTIDDSIPEDAGIADAVRQVRKTFVSAPDFVAHVNPLWSYVT
jgi:hypothetical protein